MSVKVDDVTGSTLHVAIIASFCTCRLTMTYAATTATGYTVLASEMTPERTGNSTWLSKASIMTATYVWESGWAVAFVCVRRLRWSLLRCQQNSETELYRNNRCSVAPQLLQGDYVRRWVPELQGIKGADVHTPWTLSSAALSHAGVSLGETYPTPTVIAAEWSRHVNKKPVGVLRKRKWIVW